MSDQHNPPAFPVDGHTTQPTQTGMTLRDWFAGQALSNSAICTGTAADWQLRLWFKGRGGVMPEEIAARQAHEYAKAMLAERAKGGDV